MDIRNKLTIRKSVKFDTVKTVPTYSNDKYWQKDANKDGIPDYLQKKKELQALIKPISDTNMAEIDASKEIEELEMKWRGFRYDQDSKAYVKWSNAIMNETGIIELTQMLNSHVNKHSQTTSLSEIYVHKEILDTMRIINGWLADNQIKWEIKYSDLDPLSKQIEALIFYSLCKSIGDGQRSHITQRVKITETKSNAPQEPRMSI